MIGLSLIKKIVSLFRISITENSYYSFAFGLVVEIRRGAKLIINDGMFRVGYSLPGVPNYSSYRAGGIFLEEGSELVVNNSVIIGPGVTIRVKKGGKLVLDGPVQIAHNFTMIVSKFAKIGSGTSISWNVTMIDDDNRYFSKEGVRIKGFRRPLLLGENVGIQMNVSIPRGVTIGDNAIVSSGTCLRQDVSSSTLVFSENKLKVKKGISKVRSSAS